MQEEFNKVFYLDPESPSGIRNKIKRNQRQPKDQVQGSIRKSDNRYRVQHKGVQYYSYQIVWIMVYGSLPEGLVIDHIDGNVLNNQPDNLRQCTQSQNLTNRTQGKHGRQLPRGVIQDSLNSYRQTVRLNGKVVYTKNFPTQELQSQQYERVSKEHFGEFYREVKD